MTSSDAAAGDQFGYSVCINGDYAIVGADRNDAGGVDSGSAYVFKREGSEWAQQAKITASDKWAYDLFGSSVTISGDDIIVGAPADDSNRGAAYIYSISSFPPDVEISASPETIEFGETAMLSWTSNHADTCSIEPDIGSVDLNGSISVSPTETTTYTITATGPHDTDIDSVTVTVTHPAPTVSISANPEAILPGGSSTLTWTSANTDTCIIDSGIGPVALNGSTTVSPATTATCYLPNS